MGYSNKRVGISYISKRSAPSELYNEEILVNKDTGDVSVKTPVTGNVISYNYFTRKNTHINKIRKNALSQAIPSGVILEITPDGLVLPSVSFTETNLIGATSLETRYGANAVIISIDIDTIPIVPDVISKNVTFDAIVDFKIYSVIDNDIDRMYDGSLSIDELNNTIFHFSKNSDNIVIEKILIHSKGSTYRHILNSIFLYIHKNNVYSVSDIRVLQQHTNAQYVDSPFDDTGLIVEATKADGTTEIIDDYNKEFTYIGGDE